VDRGYGDSVLRVLGFEAKACGGSEVIAFVASVACTVLAIASFQLRLSHLGWVSLVFALVALILT
jgi:hypothetical protein